jgi:hypothetical protein
MHQGLQRPVRQAAEDGVLFVARRIDQALVVGLEAVGCAPLAMIDSRCRNFLMTAPVVNQSVDAHAVPPAAHQGTVLHPLVLVTDGDSVGAHRHRFHLVRRRPLLQGPPLDQRQGTDWKSQTSINSRGGCEPNRGPPDRSALGTLRLELVAVPHLRNSEPVQRLFNGAIAGRLDHPVNVVDRRE